MPTETDYAIKRWSDETHTAKPMPEHVRIYDYVIETLDKQGKLSCSLYEFKSGRIYCRGKGWMSTKVADSPSAGRNFQTGAYRDTDNNKLDYEAFLSPTVLERYASYMHKNCVQSDGRLRDGDNWQKGIPQEVYIKSAFRHFMEWWTIHRATVPLTPAGQNSLEEALCALLFNVQGYLFEQLKERGNSESRPVKETLSSGVSDKHSSGLGSSVGYSTRDFPSLRHPD